MKTLLITTLALIACLASSLQVQPVNRRTALTTAFTSAAAAMMIPTAAPASASASTECPFCGTYSDPINHPGGKRTITLVGNKEGDYQLAQVAGGGGVGEPKNYILPAVVIGDRAIIIDFSPKGGPKDFTGVIDAKGIKFPKDGNLWPRL